MAGKATSTEHMMQGVAEARNVIVEVTAGDVTREVNLDLVAKGDTESAAVVVPADAAGSPQRRSRELHEPLVPAPPPRG